jgi:hypothetical protein
MLFVFLGSEKVKVYSRVWGNNLIIIGVISILRIFYIPYRLYFTVKIADSSAIDQWNFTYLCIMLVLSGACLIISGMIGIIKSTKLHQYMSKISRNH